MVTNRELKRVIVQLESWDTPSERYLVEDYNDLVDFLDLEDFDHCHNNPLLMRPWQRHLKTGNVLLLTDNTISGYPSYFTYPKDKLHEIKRS